MRFNIFLEPIDEATNKRGGTRLDLRDAKDGFVEVRLSIPASGKAKPIERSLGVLHLAELRAAVTAAESLMGGMR